jgi:YD repeat-containing protein
MKQLNKNIKKRMKERYFSNLSLVILVVAVFFILSCSIISGATAESYKPYLHKPSIGQYPKLNTYGTYQTQLFPGSATYSYGIEVPQGTNDLSPQLSLSYNSQSVLQSPNLVGAGWSFTSNYIMRNINFTVTDTSDDYYILNLNGYSDKVFFRNGAYNTNINVYLRIENKTISGNTYWVVTTTDGTQYRFGYSNSSVLFSNSSTYPLKWFLDYVNDTHGNTINYSYNKNPFPDDVGAMYLSNITYNRDNLRQIIFRYDDSNRPDKRIVYDQGSKFLESRRLNGIEVYFNNSLVRRYNITYTDLNSEKTLSSISNITFIGADNTSVLNNIGFEYYDSQPGFDNSSKWLIPEEFTSIDSGSQDFGSRLVDVNNDGFMDFVKSNSTVNYTKLNDKNSTWVSTSYFSVPEQIANGSNMYQGVIFIDVNRDGLTDLLKAQAGSTRVTYLNNGTAWLNATNNFFAIPADFINGIKDEGVRFVDLNGDGLIDIVQGKTSGSVKNSWINNGTNWISTPLWVLPDYFVESDGVTDTGLREIDLNGDGLTDLIKGGNPGSAWINNGTGWASDTLFQPNLQFTNSTYPDLGVRFIDINGDGLVDMIQGFFNNVTYSVLNQTCYNLTNSTQNCTNYFYNVTSYTNLKINNGTGWVSSPYWQSPENFTNNGFNTGRRIADINGDGYSDILVGYKNGSVQKETFIRNATSAFMLKRIRHEYGGTSYITYNQSTLSNNGKDLGFNLWVVNNVTINNSLNNLFNITALTKYNYLGGKFDYINYEFVGFGNVNETLPDNTTIAHFFLQTPMLKSKEYLTNIYDKNNNLIKGVFNYYTNSSNNQVFLNFTTESIYDGNPSAMVVNTSYSYDGYGNLLLANYSGNTAITGDEKYEYYNYFYNTSAYIVNKVSNYSLYNASNLLVKRSWFYYDSLTSSVNKGDLSSTIQYNSKGPNPATNYSYDSYGNIIIEVDPRGNTENSTYDSGTNTFVVKDLNALGHRTNYSYDLGTGNLIYQEKDGLYTNYTYDTFGRVTNEYTTPDNITFPTKRTTYNFDGVSPENITIETKNNDSSYGEIIYFYDGFANPVQIKTRFNPNVQITQNYLYDNKFRIIEEQAPTFEAYSKLLDTTSNSFNMRYNYDSLDRVTNITKPDNSNLSILFNNTKVIATNELGVKKDYSIDAYGRIINVSEHNRNSSGVDEIYNTSYYYDVSDNLIKIVDSQGNNFTYEYDSLGRRISMDDPDTNPWTYSYDSNGNLINQTDGRNITTFMTYDKLNRMTVKNSSLKITNITFAYDLQYNGTLGNITLQEQYFLPAYYKYTYDNRLRIIWENLSVQVKQSGSNREWINTSVNYDSQDRILNNYLPNQTLTYSYNQIGKLNSIQGFLSSINYNSYGKMINKTYANSLVTSFEYDNLSRISRIQTGTIQNLSYNYDATGSIKAINDSKNKLFYSMNYDDLDRLLYTAVFNSTDFSYENFTYVYGKLGNALSIFHIMKNILNPTSNETITSTTNMTYGNLAHAPNNVNATIMPTSINVTVCGILKYSDTIYLIQADIRTSGTCFTVLANNVTIDGQGHTISYAESIDGKGIINQGYNTTTIKNLNLVLNRSGVSGATNSGAIYLVNGKNHNITFVNILTQGQTSGTGKGYGIYLEDSENSSISNVLVNTSNTYRSDGIYLYATTDNRRGNKILNSNAYVYGLNSMGLDIYAINNGGIRDVFISNSSFYSKNSHGISVQSGTFGTGDTSIVNTTSLSQGTSTYGLYLNGAEDTFVVDSKISSVNSYDVVSNSGSHVCLNVSYFNESVTGGNITRGWYFNVKVNNTIGDNIYQANVSGGDVFGSLDFSELTDINGQITRQQLGEYIDNGTKTSYNNYTVNVTKSGYTNVSQSVNITANTNLLITLS